jgi:hypothetical protein
MTPMKQSVLLTRKIGGIYGLNFGLELRAD